MDRTTTRIIKMMMMNIKVISFTRLDYMHINVRVFMKLYPKQE